MKLIAILLRFAPPAYWRRPGAFFFSTANTSTQLSRGKKRKQLLRSTSAAALLWRWHTLSSAGKTGPVSRWKDSQPQKLTTSYTDIGCPASITMPTLTHVLPLAG